MLRFNVEYNPYIEELNRDDSNLQVKGVVVVRNEPEWIFRQHKHEDACDIVLVLDGQGSLLYENQKYTIKTGDIYIINQGVIHGEYSDPGNKLDNICLSLSGIKIDGMPENCLLPAANCPVFRTKELFQLFYYLFTLVQEECLKQKSDFKLVLKHLLSLILTLIQNRTEVCSVVKYDSDDLTPLNIQIKEYLDLNYYKNISLRELSEEFNFSPYYLAHKFKEKMGFSINQYINDRRIGETKKMLIYSQDSIKDIAAKVGYDNISHFYIMFKKIENMTPGQFRKQSIANKQPEEF